MIGGALEHQRGDGLHAGPLGFGQAGFVLTQVNDFQLLACRIEGPGHVLLGSHAHGAAGMVEDRFAFHAFGDGEFRVVAATSPGLASRRSTVRRAGSLPSGHKTVAGHHLVTG